MSAAQQLADPGHSELASHRGAHARLPDLSRMHTEPAVQHTAPHALASAQHAPPTHVWPASHAPAGLAGLHGVEGMTHEPPTQDCPEGQAPEGAAALHGAGPSGMHAPLAHRCPLGHAPAGLVAPHAAPAGGAHTPPTQDHPAAQASPQEPQLRESNERLTQAPPQSANPGLHPELEGGFGPHAAKTAQTDSSRNTRKPLM